MPPKNGNGTKAMVPWLLGILASLITTGVIAGVGLGWQSSKTMERVEVQVEELKEDLREYILRDSRDMERMEDKLDAHVGQTSR
jgi:hypothetical protein